MIFPPRSQEGLMPLGTGQPGRSGGEAADRRPSRTMLKFRPELERLEFRRLLAAGTRPNEIGQGSLTPLLHVERIHPALKKSAKPTLTALMTAGPDTAGVVTIAGRAYGKARIVVDVSTNGSTGGPA